MDYKKAYYVTFNAITKAINELEKSIVVSPQAKTISILKDVQRATEEMYISETTDDWIFTKKPLNASHTKC